MKLTLKEKKALARLLDKDIADLKNRKKLEYFEIDTVRKELDIYPMKERCVCSGCGKVYVNELYKKKGQVHLKKLWCSKKCEKKMKNPDNYVVMK